MSQEYEKKISDLFNKLCIDDECHNNHENHFWPSQLEDRVIKALHAAEKMGWEKGRKQAEDIAENFQHLLVFDDRLPKSVPEYMDTVCKVRDFQKKQIATAINKMEIGE